MSARKEGSTACATHNDNDATLCLKRHNFLMGVNLTGP
jgi:hypothetical protein